MKKREILHEINLYFIAYLFRWPLVEVRFYQQEDLFLLGLAPKRSQDFHKHLNMESFATIVNGF